MDTPTAISRLQTSRCPEAWAFLYNEYRPEVRRFAGWLLRDDTAADDMTQELFLRLPHRIRTYDPARGEFKPWLVTITANFAKNWAEKNSSPEILTDPRAIELPEEVRASHERERRARTLLYDTVEDLSTEDRAAVGAFLAGYTSREVAERNNEPPRQARQRLHKAVKHLKHEVLQ